MAFKCINNSGLKMPAVIYLPAGAITPKMGMGLALDSSTGKLAVSAKPQYISLIDCAAALTSGTVIPVMKIEQTMLFESEVDGSTSLKAGARADVADGGLKIDGDGSTNQVFLIEYIGGTTEGSVVRGRFVRSDGDDNVDADTIYTPPGT